MRDLTAGLCGSPLARLLGAVRTTVAVDGSGRSTTPDEQRLRSQVEERKSRA